MPRGIANIQSLREIRSMHTTGKRSIPRVQSSACLDLYMIRMEKGRLEKEKALIEKRIRGIEKKLKDIEKQEVVLEKASKAEQIKEKEIIKEQVKEQVQEKKWKTMPLGY